MTMFMPTPNLVLSALRSLGTLVLQAQTPAAQPGAPVTPPQMNVPHDPPLDPKLPTVFIVGDSTARNGADLGWATTCELLRHQKDQCRETVRRGPERTFLHG